MNCKEIRGLILSDYLDEQMDDEQKARINIHFAHCNDCREFFLNAKKTVKKPFLGAQNPNLPEFIWQNIKETIILEQQQKEKRFVFHFPRPAIAIATAIPLILIVGIMIRMNLGGKETQNISAQGKIEYFINSLEAPVDTLTNDEAGFGSSIEKYFM